MAKKEFSVQEMIEELKTKPRLRKTIGEFLPHIEEGKEEFLMFFVAYYFGKRLSRPIVVLSNGNIRIRRELQSVFPTALWYNGQHPDGYNFHYGEIIESPYKWDQSILKGYVARRIGGGLPTIIMDMSPEVVRNLIGVDPYVVKFVPQEEMEVRKVAEKLLKMLEENGENESDLTLEEMDE